MFLSERTHSLKALPAGRPDPAHPADPPALPNKTTSPYFCVSKLPAYVRLCRKNTIMFFLRYPPAPFFPVNIGKFPQWERISRNQRLPGMELAE
jgi:hypothetical protein